MFSKPTEKPGAIITVDPLAARHDLIFGAPEPIVYPESISYLQDMPDRHLQNGAPFCVSYSTTHIREYYAKKDGNYNPLEPDYVALASHTGPSGNSVQAVLDTERAIGIPLASDFTYDPHSFNGSLAPYPVPALSNEAQVRALPYKWSGYAFLDPASKDGLKSSLQKGPIGVTIGIDGAIFGARTEGSLVPASPNTPQAYHCLVAVGYNANGLQIFDSLRISTYYLAWDYGLTSAFTLVDLPPNWQTTQQTAIDAQAKNNANRYGKVRDFNAEQHAGSLLLSAFQAFKNKSVLDAAGRFWTIYIRCFVYGNYSTTDIINDCYNWRRTGQHIFDLDKTR